MSFGINENQNMSLILSTNEIQLNNQIDTTKKYLAQIEQNSFIIPECNSPYLQDKKLSPWLQKKRNNKNNGNGNGYLMNKNKKINEIQQIQQS